MKPYLGPSLFVSVAIAGCAGLSLAAPMSAVISDGGVGPFRMSQAVPSGLEIEWKFEETVLANEEQEEGTRACIKDSGRCLSMFFDAGKIALIVIESKHFRTPDGLGVGSTLRELLAKRPHAILVGNSLEGGHLGVRVGLLSFLLPTAASKCISLDQVDRTCVSPDAVVQEVLVFSKERA